MSNIYTPSEVFSSFSRVMIENTLAMKIIIVEELLQDEVYIQLFNMMVYSNIKRLPLRFNNIQGVDVMKEINSYITEGNTKLPTVTRSIIDILGSKTPLGLRHADIHKILSALNKYTEVPVMTYKKTSGCLLCHDTVVYKGLCDYCSSWLDERLHFRSDNEFTINMLNSSYDRVEMLQDTSTPITLRGSYNVSYTDKLLHCKRVAPIWDAKLPFTVYY